MIRKTWGADKWLLIPQHEHARLSGVIAASWNFGKVRPHRELLIAISRHDDGWKAVENHPRINEAGAPLSFLEMDQFESFEAWSRSSAALADEKKYYAARLVAAHFVHLVRNEADMAKLSPRKAVAMGRFIGEQQARMAQWKRLGDGSSSPGITVHDVETVFDDSPDAVSVAGTFQQDLRLLQVCDLLSLLLCTDFSGSTEIADVPYLESGDTLTVTRPNTKLTLTVSPFPFRKNLRDHVSSILIPRRAYSSDTDLQEIVGNTSTVTQEFLIGPA
jgi:hypothetical protein